MKSDKAAQVKDFTVIKQADMKRAGWIYLASGLH